MLADVSGCSGSALDAFIGRYTVDASLPSAQWKNWSVPLHIPEDLCNGFNCEIQISSKSCSQSSIMYFGGGGYKHRFRERIFHRL